MLNHHYLRNNKGLQYKIFAKIEKYYRSNPVPIHIKECAGEEYDFTRLLRNFRMEEVSYCGANFIYNFPHRQIDCSTISNIDKRQIIVDTLSVLTNFTSQIMCWLRNASQDDSIKILMDMGFEVLANSKNASSNNEMKLLCFDWYDEDCCKKIEKFMYDGIAERQVIIPEM